LEKRLATDFFDFLSVSADEDRESSCNFEMRIKDEHLPVFSEH